MTGAVDSTFARALARIVGEDAVTSAPEDLATYGRDWTRVHAPRPQAIVFPRSATEVAALVSLAAGEGVAIVPSGGRTGLAGGAVAAHGELVLSLERMRAMDVVDERGLTVRVEAGAVTEAVHRHVAPLELTWPVDFASKGSSQVGGNIATNAGGVKVIRYGLTRQWVLGLEVVLPSGELVSLNGALEKNNTGLDLRQLFIGSEGTLGIVTAATLKLVRRPTRLDVLLFAVDDLERVLTLFSLVRSRPVTLAAYEFFTDRCAARVKRHRGIEPPFDRAHPTYVLVELEAADEDAVLSLAEHALDAGVARDAVVAPDDGKRAYLWSLRESVSECLSATGLPHKNDVSLPVARVADYCAALEAFFAVNYPGFEICLFGHVGDGNIHVNVMKPDTMSSEEFFSYTHAADRATFELVRAHGGSISAEHGIGLLKKDFLSYSRSTAELTTMRAIKRALDPSNLMNPGKIFDVPSAERSLDEAARGA